MVTMGKVTTRMMPTASGSACEMTAPDVLPDGLLDAFWRYDEALLANDRTTLDDLFMPGPHTLRGDGRTLLVGHDAIAGFRSARAKVPTRTVVELHVQVVAPDTALLMASTRDGDATGLQTQLWRLLDGDRWAVAAAHVSLPTAAPRSGTPATTTPGGGFPTAFNPTAFNPTAFNPTAFDRTVWRTVGDPLVAATAPGPLDAYGVAVKDLFDVAGQPVGAGVPAWLAEQRPRTHTAPAVTALLRAGAHVAGIARTDEFAYSLAGTNAHYGTPPNPAAPGSVSGGSTSGPAAAVALGQADVGLGTDTAGSIRVPASYQGLVGLRTTHGAISTAGVLPLAPSFDTVGWLTRDVRTSAAVARTLLGQSRDDDAAAVARTVRLPVLEELASAEVRDTFTGTVESLHDADALPPFDSVDLERPVLESWFAAFRTVQAWEAWQAHGEWITAHPGALGADVAGRFAQAAEVTERQWQQAREVVAEAREQVRSWLTGTVLVIPSASGPAPGRTATGERIEAERAATLRMTCLAGLAGAPALSLPLLRLADGRPAGVCLLGAPGTDHALLTLAAGLETPR
ncbi:amidase [Streptomyces aurantiacus]|uniref:amidase n=1 Tax=Streptomyces aurantiacus TaxID=47760 RepID=UPI0027900CE2|nr:amidase [Streptomyces aurantiacus]MDQ0777502.1 amidase [Streptomyces aurantiacus]